MRLFRDDKGYSLVGTDEVSHTAQIRRNRQIWKHVVFLALHLVIFGGWVITTRRFLDHIADSSGEQRYAALGKEPLIVVCLSFAPC